MNDKHLNEKELWSEVASMLGNRSKSFGRHWSFNYRNDPKRLAFVLSRYKFAAKMACKNKSILELGCSEGIGAPILSEFALQYTGVDSDEEAINTAIENLPDPRFRFIKGDIFDGSFGQHDTVISLDVIEHIFEKYEQQFFNVILASLNKDGICIIGTPNLTSESYASSGSKAGHVNLYDADRLAHLMGQYFHNVFLFGMNDEVVHTGFLPMSHYLICVGCYIKTQRETNGTE